MTRRLILMAMLVAVVTGISLRADEPPQYLNYQGVLRNASDAPLTGTYDMTFRFYDSPAGGTLLLTDQHIGIAPVTVSGGLFHVFLGNYNVIPGAEPSIEAVFKNHSVTFLETQVGSETLSPRVQIVSAAYAQNAHALDGKEASDFALASHNQDASTITSGTLAVARGGTGLATPGASGNVLTSNGSAWVSSPLTGGGSDGDWTISGTTMYSGVSGNVGIGTASPSNRLTVSGPGFGGGSGLFQSNDSGNYVAVSGSSTGTNDSAFLALGDGIPGDSAYLGLAGTAGAGFGSVGDLRFAVGGNAEAMRLSKTGNLGIGTTLPQVKIEASGPGATAGVETQEIARLVRPGVTDVKNANSAGFFVGTFEPGIDGRGRLDINLSGPPNSGNNWGVTPDVTVMTLQADGRVGIGTTAVSSKLQVNSAVGNFYNYNGNANDVPASVTFFGQQGNGPTSHSSVLNVVDAATDSTDTQGAGISFGGRFTTGSLYGIFGRIRGVKDTPTDNVYTGKLIFETIQAPDGTLRERMRINSEGNVGIGTADPSSTLDVSGSAHVSGALKDSSGSAGAAGQVLQSTGTGTQWATGSGGDADAVVGNEVLDASDSTFSRTGAGTASDPYKLKLNLANSNTWTGGQTFQADTRFGGGGVWTSAGNVGIGIYPPAEALEVAGNLRIWSQEIYLRDDNNHGLGWHGAGKLFAGVSVDGPALYGWSGGALGTTDPAQKIALYWNKDGRVGIGTTTLASDRLQVRAEDAAASNTAISALAQNGTTKNWAISSLAGSASAPGTLNADNRGGYFVATAPDLGGPSTATGVWAQGFGKGDGTVNGVLARAENTGSGWAVGLHGQATGSLGKSLAGQFDGDVLISQPSSLGIGMVASGYRLQLISDSAAKPSTNTWTIASDERLKKDIAPFTDGLSVIEKIKPVTYKYNGLAGLPKDMAGIGVVAQEIKEVAPYTVGTFKAMLSETDKSETELYDFNSHALTFVLINAVKELDERTKSLASSSGSSGTSAGQASGLRPGGEESGATAGSTEASQPIVSGSAGTMASTVYPVCEPVDEGDVLTVDEARPGLFCLARQAADPGVVGVVSAISRIDQDAGAAEDLNAAAHVSMATTGVALCKVDASFGPIAVRDLLVASPNPGHAMKGLNPAPGTVIGKALEPLEAGTGTIKVLVMLR